MPKQKLTFNIKDVTIAKEGLIVYKDSYWVCQDSDPSKALFYGNSPQCNKNEIIAASQLDTLYPKELNVGIVFIETAFVPQRN